MAGDGAAYTKQREGELKEPEWESVDGIKNSVCVCEMECVMREYIFLPGWLLGHLIGDLRESERNMVGEP